MIPRLFPLEFPTLIVPFKQFTSMNAFDVDEWFQRSIAPDLWWQRATSQTLSRRMSVRRAVKTKNKTPGADQGTGHIQKRSNDKTT